MALSREEGLALPTTSGKGFGRASPDRNAIIQALADGGFKSPDEIAKDTGLDAKVIKTRCTVMVRDKITVRAYKDKGTPEEQVYFGLTDKGITRAEGKADEAKKKKKKK